MLHPHATCASYEILRALGQGVYTEIYEARHVHPKLRERPVTLKLLRHRHGASQFMQAARINAALQHPRIPELFDVGGDAAGQLFYSCRMFVDGDDLLNGLRARRDITEVATIVADLAAAVDHAHSQGIIHGLIHPRHILVGRDGQAWLIGFGEFPPLEPAALGNPLHLAPEQLTPGRALTPATDVYALAETTLWLLSGWHPFKGLRNDKLLAAKRTDGYERPRAATQALLPSAVDQVLRWGMAAAPADRYASAGEFATALLAAAHSQERRE